MHNLDRSQLELENEFEDSDFGDSEFGISNEWEQEASNVSDSPFDESEEMELASELLQVGSEEELEYFLGSLIKKAVKGVSRFARSKAGRALGGILKGIAKKALPIVGTAAGGFFGGPIGAKIGGSLGNVATGLFEMEIEGLSPEDQEFEIARRIVRLAGDAAQKAADAPAGVHPIKLAKAAIKEAAKQHAPGLELWYGGGRQANRSPQIRRYGARTGRWYRRGRSIVVVGA